MSNAVSVAAGIDVTGVVAAFGMNSARMTCLFLASLFALVPVQSLRCVVCNSYLHGDACADWDTFSFIQSCNETEGKPKCAKIVQQSKEDSRVIRKCSTAVVVDGCIKRASHEDGRIRYCHCSGDLCNSVSALVLGPTAYLGVLCALFFPF
ncbi:hypothetical protein AAHC03_026097 [Spirometra sp. Aus1]